MCKKDLSKNFQSGLRVVQSTETALFNFTDYLLL